MQEAINLFGSIVYTALSAFIAIIAVYIGLMVFTKLTRNIDEVAELKRGNAAVGVTLAAVAVVIGLVTLDAIPIITTEFLSGRIASAIMLAVIQLVTNILIAVFTQFVVIGIFNELTRRKGLNQFEEVKNGNIAIGIGLAGIILMVGIILQNASGMVTDAVTSILRTLI
ncbi:hypothetical protein HRbin04_00433 [archaeon HR04]|uniref:Hypothetical conserved protein n=2 Tax=Thermoproteati TaxID=1783275 RepID=Q4LEJ0_9ARCH|nr:hypothetical conserved protein [uncultured Candidatus Nitrosocaldus sp.]BAL60296.1 hypothetical conserved protein [uncultured crenarchaeote]GBC73037.1 hypothetical protein HRbin04_00433 [archaeon HR04]